MKIYNCDVCGSLIYFENTICVSCGSQLGYLPVLDNMSSLEAAGGVNWKAVAPQAEGGFYKKCQNYHKENICNWMISCDAADDFCLSCQFNEIIPDLSIPENRAYWHRLEIAKRRLVYSLLRLGLPLKNKKQFSQDGLAFAFLSDDIDPVLKETESVLTGHDQGKITININEANDVIREKMRLDMNERYRTLLGHFRHEIGHYYYFLLVEPNNDLLMQFRNLFGNEQVSYDESLKQYYTNGAPDGWQQWFVSKYASAHPWEDWAESWAHYLHMYDTLETASSWGLSLKFNKINGANDSGFNHHLQTFEEMRDQWIYISSALNSLNRSMGMKDVYPFVWSNAVIEKLRFVQQVIINFKKEE